VLSVVSVSVKVKPWFRDDACAHSSTTNRRRRVYHGPLIKTTGFAPWARGYIIKKVGMLVVLECGPEQCFRLHDHLPGFSQAVDRITARLPGIDSRWLEPIFVGAGSFGRQKVRAYPHTQRGHDHAPPVPALPEHSCD